MARPIDRAVSLLLTLALLVSATLSLTPRTAGAASSEFRAYWVDAFGPGMFKPAEIDKLVAAVKAAHLNAIVAQVGRRGDCFCNLAAMPRTQAAIDPLPYDPLQTLITKAHAAGIQVHAWIITTAMWNSGIPPRDPTHAFNTHGPSKAGTHDYWLGVKYDGSIRETLSPSANYFFDPGHPDAAKYMVDMYTSVARNYDIDGLNFDRVRYPDIPDTRWPRDNAWGYNPVALARFHAATGRTDKPLPNDLEWSQWRRDQITNVVRRVYVETYAFKPGLRITADTITYGDGPQGYSNEWTQTRPYRETLQDWRGWLEEGILDTNIPMNYKREHCTGGAITGCFNGADQRTWYVNWSDWAKDHQYRRSTTVGSALYLNTIANSVIQVRKAIAPSAAGNLGIGWVGYSYRTPDDLANANTRSGDASRAELTTALTQPSAYDPITPPVFADTATIPPMAWKVAPVTGHLMGAVTTNTGTPIDQIRVNVYDADTDAFVTTRLTDGTGWFGFVDLVPGTYKVFVPDDARVTGKRVAIVKVTAGTVADVTITPFAKGEEGKRPLGGPAGVDQPVDPTFVDDLPNGER